MTPEENFQALCERWVSYMGGEAKRMVEIIAMAAIETEREACAKIAIDRIAVDKYALHHCEAIAAAIRARGEKIEEDKA